MGLIASQEDALFPELYWMAVAACVFGFFMSFGIGANDVGNCFATTVAAKSLTLVQAVGVAAVFEFAGAALLGASVTKTIRSNILDMEAYEDDQEVLAFGMLVSLVNASFWLILATAYGLPVSTTHTIIAAIVGFSLAAKGWDSIMWADCSKIFISWIAAPGVTAIIGYLFFYLIRTFVLKSSNPFNRSAMTYSLTIFVTLTINVFFVMHKGLKKFELETGLKLAIAFGASFVLALIFQFAIVGWLKERIVKAEDVAEKEKAQKAQNKENALETANINEDDESDTNAEEDNKSKVSSFFSKIADATYKRDLESESLHLDKDAADIWDKAEVYDAKSERLYSYLQVFTACALSFAHGSNDVANAVAPICAVLAIYEHQALTEKTPVPQWVLVMGAVGIVIGLFCFGYKVIISIGYRLTKLSPSRGFCIQLSTTLVVVSASYAGIPVSTTQSTIGGTIGVGAVEGLGGVQWWFMAKVFFGWVVTFFVTCLSSAGIMAFAYYSPSGTDFKTSLFNATLAN